MTLEVLSSSWRLLALASLSACAAMPEAAPPAGPAPAPTKVSAPAATAPAAAAPAPAPASTVTPPAVRPAVTVASPPPAPPPGSPPPFATVIKDARRIEGPLVLWQKDERLWIELAPGQFEKPFLFSPKLRTGIGEGMLLGGLMADGISGAGGTQVIEFVRVHNQVRLQARNTDVYARPGTPEARSVASSYSASLLGSTAVASQPHPERKSVLIDAGAIFLNDLLGVGMQLQRMFRQGYGLERSNTTITAARGSADATVIETLNHYFTGNIATFSFAPPGSIVPPPQVPRYVPDTRSLLIGHHYSISPLPAKPMAARRADARIGHFTSTTLDFSDDLSHTPRQRVIRRWRLDKQDPAAEASEPVKPITFWIDRNVPLQYRDTVKEAILEWNKAFDRIGFRNAIVVQQQPDDATVDTLDTGYASVRWMTNADASFLAIGPSHIDPRTGEILDADVAIESTTSRASRAERVQVLGSRALDGGAPALPGTSMLPEFAAAPWREMYGDKVPLHLFCTHGLVGAEQLTYMLDVIDARGETSPGDPNTQRYVLAHIKDTVMHEIGHALGLRHNFRASRVYTEAQLADPAFTAEHGTAGSVMDYTPVNLARPGQQGGAPFQTTLGPYDYWAIEYAYKPMPAGTTPEQEEVELQRVASRSAEPDLAYGTDEDSWVGLDPETLQWDLGSDPVAYAAKRLEIARDLFKRQETRILPGDRDYAVLRRSLGFAIGDAFRAVGVLVRQIGGVRTLRDHPGSGRDPLQPVATTVQRAALDLILTHVLAADGLSVSPALQRKLAPDYLDRLEIGVVTDYAVPQRLLDLQRAVLAYLLSDTVASRVLDNVNKVDRGGEPFRLSELYGRLSGEVWHELGSPKPTTAARRELQRDHVTRLAMVLLRPAILQRADARSLMREDARQLLARIESRLKRPQGLDAETRAHLGESAETLRQALAARVVRPTV